MLLKKWQVLKINYLQNQALGCLVIGYFLWNVKVVEICHKSMDPRENTKTIVIFFLGISQTVWSCPSVCHILIVLNTQYCEVKLMHGKCLNHGLREHWEDFFEYFIQARTALWYSSFLCCGSLKNFALCPCIKSCSCQWIFCGKPCRFETGLKNRHLALIQTAWLWPMSYVTCYCCLMFGFGNI